MALVTQVACASRPAITPLAFASAPNRDTSVAMGVRISQVVSGGTWSKGPSSGHYRIVVSSDGDVDNHYKTVVQWMGRNSVTHEVELLFSVDLRSVGTRWYSLLDPELKLKGGRWILTLDASDAPLKPAVHRPSFELGEPGSIRER